MMCCLNVLDKRTSVNSTISVFPADRVVSSQTNQNSLCVANTSDDAHELEVILLGMRVFFSFELFTRIRLNM